MSNAIREMIGWVLIVLALYIYRICFSYLNERFIVEAIVGGSLGTFVLRAGMQLLKVSIAARAIRSENAPTKELTS